MIQRRSILWIAGAVLLVALLTAMFVQKGDDALADFTVFHTAGERFIQGEQLYRAADGHYQFKYFPWSAVFFAPLGLLPLTAAKYAWLLVTLGAIVGLVRFSYLLTFGPDRGPGWVVVVTVLAMAKFYLRELELGQTNALFTSALLAGVWLLVQRSRRGPGVLTGLAVALKPYAVIFLPWQVLKRTWQTVTGTLGVVIVIMAIPLVRYGLGGFWDLLRGWSTTVAGSTPGLLTNPDNVSLFGAAAKWFGAESIGAVYLIALLSAATLGLAMLWATTRRISEAAPKSVRRRAFAAEASMLLLLVPLVSPQGWDYVFLTATPGIMLLLGAWFEVPRWQRILLALCLAVGGLSVYDVMGRDFYHAFMNASVLTVVFVVILLLVIGLRLRLTGATSQ